MTQPSTDRIATGIAGLDTILNGGLTANRIYLLEGTPGTGKTTMALQFLLDGAARGESGLYVTLSETAGELRASARTHGWSLDALTITEILAEDGLDPTREQTILHASELELGETMERLVQVVEQLRPHRIVFDSLSEFRLLAQSPLRYRRQILTLKQFFARVRATVILLDDRSIEPTDLQLHSIAHGVLRLEQVIHDYGVERRRLRVIKMRGIKFQGGYHDFELNTGGLQVFPRLVAADHHHSAPGKVISSGSSQLDEMLGGGLMPGSNLLLRGPSGVGKSTTTVNCMIAAARQGLDGVYYLFDESLGTLTKRCETLGLGLQPFLQTGCIALEQIDPAALSPGEFATRVRDAVANGSRFVVIDSLDGYLQAMPGQQFLLLHMHELLTFLNQQGVVTIVILGQHGLVGEGTSEVDLSYLCDAVLLFRYFEARGSVRTALSAIKSRTLPHERTIREFRIVPSGIEVGEALTGMEGVLSGLPRYSGTSDLLGAAVDEA